MSFVIFEGDFNPSKVEVAVTDLLLIKSLIVLIFQDTV